MILFLFCFMKRKSIKNHLKGLVNDRCVLKCRFEPFFLANSPINGHFRLDMTHKVSNNETYCKLSVVSVRHDTKKD